MVLRVSRKQSGDPEIFYSLQGEGASIGIPTVFLRLATCNLNCSWCDTKYTWDWRHHDYETEVMSLQPEEIERRVLDFKCNHLVITGGEPLIQQKALAPLTLSLKSRGFYCEVETNGTIPPSPTLRESISQWNVSPKLSNSGVSQGKRESHQALKSFANLDNSYFKFVISNPPDVDEVHNIIQQHNLPSSRVILMPEGTDPLMLQSRSAWLSKICIERGFRFSTRLHILLWGDERGR